MDLNPGIINGLPHSKLQTNSMKPTQQEKRDVNNLYGKMMVGCLAGSAQGGAIGCAVGASTAIGEKVVDTITKK